MDKLTSSNDRPPSQSKENQRNPNTNRSLSLLKGTPHRKGLIWTTTILFILFIVVIIINADRGSLPDPLKFFYTFAGGDKIGHFVLIGLLTFLVNLSLSARRIELFSRSVLLGSFVVAIAVIIEELSQLFISTRSCSLSDLVFDFLGIGCASWLISKLSALRKKTLQ